MLNFFKSLFLLVQIFFTLLLLVNIFNLLLLKDLDMLHFDLAKVLLGFFLSFEFDFISHYFSCRLSFSIYFIELSFSLASSACPRVCVGDVS